MAIRVITVDDHPVVRAGVRALIDEAEDLQVVAEGRDGAEAVELFEQYQPDVVVMDVRMPNVDGVRAIRDIVASHPEARILALTSYDGDADIYRAIQAGARGYLLKDTLGTSLIDAVRKAAAGERIIPEDIAGRLADFIDQEELTPRELEVLELAAKGMRNREIARAISRSEETVKVHLKNVMRKLGVADRTEAVTLALRRGLIHIE
ncbi:MAG TPA: response regulator transcription factor [Gemmatimonadaceae bacterium]|jgi:DNA-binding NarL/FixJ family response regulator|nr:response regulator transcription factor [Gemmatimonadaceae bacterium]